MMNYTELMEANLQNLRQSLSRLTLDDFIVNTLEGLMEVERKEYLKKQKIRRRKKWVLFESVSKSSEEFDAYNQN